MSRALSPRSQYWPNARKNIMSGGRLCDSDSATFMDFDSDSSDLRSAHVIVVGNEKGGAGKSTISIHLTVALLKAGYRVASIDLDTRQQTLTRFFENRRSWGASANWPIELPHHRAMV